MLFKSQASAIPPAPVGLREAAHALAKGRLSARAYCEACLERIHASESKIKAWATLDDARALALAAARDTERARSKQPGTLHGVPVGVKDIFDTDDLPTEMGSPAFVANQPRKNAELVQRMIGAGAYVIGKTATTEFAFLHPAETRSHTGRIVFGFGRCGGRRTCSGRCRNPNERIGDQACGVLRHCGFQAEPGHVAGPGYAHLL
jgi:Asp-tRNA(Asn)/Glu-tRNA(Gln) amidotransferase A subunit family amidase